jgi:restriction endonuclease
MQMTLGVAESDLGVGTGKTYVYLRTVFELNKRYSVTPMFMCCFPKS